VLFAPGLPDLDAIRAMCGELGRPVNVVQGFSGGTFTLAELEAAGVKRVSVGGSFVRAELTALRDAATEVKERGTFTYAGRIMSTAETTRYMRQERL